MPALRVRRLSLARRGKPEPRRYSPRLRPGSVKTQRAIDASCALVEIAADVAEHVGKSDCIISSKFNRFLGEPDRLGSLFRAIDHPPVALSRRVSARRPGIGGSEGLVAANRLHEEPQRMVDVLSIGYLSGVDRQAAQIEVVGVQVLRRLAPGMVDFSLLDLGRDRADYA